MSDMHNVFISHRHEDDELVGDLKKLLARHGAEVRDSSVTNEIPNRAKADEYIRSLLRDRIEWAGKIIVIISPETSRHEWVDWEIAYANKFPDKRIIGVWAPHTTKDDMPEALEDFADAIVNWDGQAIIDAINGADNWRDPDGEPEAPRSITRAPC